MPRADETSARPPTPRSTRRGRPRDPAEPREKAQLFLERSVRRRLRMWAALLDLDLSEIVNDAVREHLDRLDAERAKRGLPPLPQE